MQIRKIASQLRLATTRLFNEHGITVAFPQRDVHLDTPGPIDVRVLGTGAET